MTNDLYDITCICEKDKRLKVGRILRRFRILNGFSGCEIVARMNLYGSAIAERTYYGLECGRGILSAMDYFALLEIFGQSFGEAMNHVYRMS